MVRRQGRPAPYHYQFVQIEIALDELIARMPEDVRAKMEPRRISDFFPKRKSAPKEEGESGRLSPKLEDTQLRLKEAYPKYEPTSIPKTILAGAAQRRIHREVGGPLIALSTVMRAMGRKK